MERETARRLTSGTAIRWTSLGHDVRVGVVVNNCPDAGWLKAETPVLEHVPVRVEYSEILEVLDGD